MQFPDNNSSQQSKIPHHTYHRFSQTKQPNIFFNSCFDSANLNTVKKNSYDHYSIWTASDAQGTSNQGYPKSWFYFQTGGFLNRKVTFSIHRVHFLWAMVKKNNLYRPVFKVKYSTQVQNKQTKWQRLPHPILSLSLNDQEQLILKFDFFFSKQIESVFFAFIYPYSYQDLRSDMQILKSTLTNDQDIFFRHYQMAKSYEKRIIDMIIISSHEGKQGFQNIKLDQCFDLGDKEKNKLVKFRNNKPIIFISARVHPIETPSSFCMKGIIQFLIDKKDFRSFLLRKYFVFVLIPMLNPDGVSNGHCRMDSLNQNLNRFYKTPDPIRQPSCYAVRKLCQHYQKDKRLFLYLDLHAHPAHKGNFMFGNAIYDFIQQVQSQLFPKIISENCINFEFQQCIFSRKHMKAKDKNQDLSKEGCGRVVFYKDFGVTHAYTLQCGYHLNGYNNTPIQEKNIEKKYIVRYWINQQGSKIFQPFQKIMSIQILTKYQEQIKQSLANKNEQILQSTNLQKINNQQKVKTSSNITSLRQKKQKNKNSRYSNQNSFIGYQIFEFTKQPLDDINNQYYIRQIPLYKQEAFLNLGKNILVSILDIFSKNPYSREVNLNQRRKQIADKQSKLDRFRKQQAGIRNKLKNVVQLIQEQFYSHWYKRNVFNHTITNSNNPNQKRRNKTLQFQVIKSSHKMRNIQKQTEIESLKDNNQIKATIQRQQNQIYQKQTIPINDYSSNNSNNITSLNKELPQGRQKTQSADSQMILSKKFKSLRKKRQDQLYKQAKPQIVMLSENRQTKIQVNYKEEELKSSQIPTQISQKMIEQEIKLYKNQGLCYSSKVIKIKNSSYNMTNLRIRNLILQGQANNFQKNLSGSHGNKSINSLGNNITYCKREREK